MGTYIPNSHKEQQEMLKICGFNDFADMFTAIPKDVFLQDGLNLPEGQSELTVKRTMENLASENKVYKHNFYLVILILITW